jgi:hypothetical protein
MAEELDVSTPSAEAREMAAKWDLIADLNGGTDAMRARRERWLPMEPRETNPQYEVRLRRTFLFPKYANTVGKWLGQALQQGIDTSACALPKEYLEDFDRSGNDITVFARKFLQNAVDCGLAHCFVDYSITEEGLTLADARARGARPYAINVDPRTVLGWRQLPGDGAEKLQRVRFTESEQAPASEWDDNSRKERIRVLTRLSSPTDAAGRAGPDRIIWQVYEKQGKQEDGRDVWIPVDGGQFTGMSEIPWVTVYGNRTGFMTAKPTLLHLADLNLCHWQSYSDHRNILRLTAVPMLGASGLSQDEAQSEVVIAPWTVLKSTDPNARFAWIEFTGAAATHTRQHLLDIESAMDEIGSAILDPEKAPGDVTATAQAIAAAETAAALDALIDATEDGLNNIVAHFGRWLGMSDAGTVTIPRRKTPEPGDTPAEQGTQSAT